MPERKKRKTSTSRKGKKRTEVATQAEILPAKDLWEHTFDSMPDLIAILDDKHRIVRANKAMAQRLGVTVDSCIGLNCFKCVHKLDSPPSFCPHILTVADGKEHVAEVHEDNLGGDFLVSTTPLFDQKGKIIGSVHVARDITQRKKAEEEVKSLSRFPAENPNVVMRISKDGNILYSNNAGLTILSEWNCKLGQPVPDKWRQLVADVFKSGMKKEFEEEHDNQTFLIMLAPIVGEGYVNVYGRDITERKKVEDDLKESEERFRAIAETSPIQISVSRASDGTILFTNPAYDRLFGFATRELIGFQAPNLYADPAEREAIIDILKKQGFVRDYEVRVKRKDGTPFWVATSVAPIRFGGEQALLGVSIDIAERKEAEEALRKAHEELEMRVQERTIELSRASEKLQAASLYTRSLIEASLDPLVTINAEGKITDVNKATEESTGFSREQLIGSDFSDYFTSPEEARKGYRQVFAEGFVRDYPLAIRHKSGKTTDVLYNATVYRNEAGEMQGVFAAARDITERKKAEEALQKAHEELETRVEERTKELKEVGWKLQAEIAEHKQIEQNLKFLSSASEAVSSSLDSKTIVSNVAKLAVPAMADWCTVDLIDENGSVNLIAVSHQDPDKVKWALELRRTYPLQSDGPIGVPNVIRTGKPEIYPNITDSMLQSIAKNDEELRILRSVGYNSVMVVPIKSGSHVYGALSLVTAESNRQFGNLELDMATEIARKIASALENSKLYQNQLLTEEELRGTNSYLDNLINYANAPIIVWNQEYCITRFNHAFERLTGLKAEDVVGKPLEILFPEDSKEESVKHIRQATSGTRWETVEIPILRTGGSVRTVLWNSANILGKDGATVVATIAQGEDITERKQALESLRESQKDLNRAQTVAMTGSWRLDVRDNILRWSDETYRMFGIPKGTPLSYETFLNIVHPEDREYVDQRWQAAMKGEPYDIEHRIIVDERVKWVREKAELEFNKDGVFLGGFGTVQDVTEKREMHAKLEEYSQHLEQLVEQKTQELKEAQRMATIGETAGMVGHDIRNPLQSIEGAVYLAREELKTLPDGSSEKKELYEILEMIRHQSNYIDHIVADLQDFSRTPMPQLRETNLHELVKEALSTTEIPENIQIQTQIQDDLKTVTVDPVFIKRVFLNLIENAAHAMPKGGKLAIKAFREGECTFIHVEDTGAGISEENKPKIFTPLFTTKSKGQGFGLAVCKKLVEAHNGEITFESEAGKGTVFKMKLPQRKETT